MTTTNSDGFPATVTLHSIAISVADLGRSIEWWKRVFGFDLVVRTHFEAVNAEVAVIQGAGFRLELLQVLGRHRIPDLFAEPAAHLLAIGTKALVLQTDDLPATTRELDTKGVTILWRELDLGTGPSTAIRDNDGNLINIFQRL
jgi:catechol 2,3-dioxygenase-like lactoylglutathione lyase family enzyme